MESAVAERLARVGRKSTGRLTHYGRKSGRPYEVTIWFLVDGETESARKSASLISQAVGSQSLGVRIRRPSFEGVLQISSAGFRDGGLGGRRSPR
jgi:hypothetical protein